jgi:hypothetical protein
MFALLHKVERSGKPRPQASRRYLHHAFGTCEGLREEVPGSVRATVVGLSKITDASEGDGEARNLRLPFARRLAAPARIDVYSHTR